ncbi:hypothetical protein FIT72_04210 [Candidatus Methylopumilus universalis]|uniref:hypothetical protein n=1 Tax=Candidatus Methylopumilus universalis TaxID=2588536 RepID=UPI0011219449|nr:hypothetical protein [Candidatus Methylopumilus universalis]QDC70752.1 hypothetical protein FIT72_04210 [Candidatus Methylopumilus universalis]
MYVDGTRKINGNDLIIMLKENRKLFFSIFFLTILLQVVLFLNTPVVKRVTISTASDYSLKNFELFESYITREFLSRDIKYHEEKNGIVIYISTKKLNQKNTQNQIQTIWNLLDNFLINNSEILIESCKKSNTKIFKEKACEAISKNKTGGLAKSEYRKLSEAIFVFKIHDEDALWQKRLILKIFHSIILSVVIFYMLQIFRGIKSKKI